LEVAVVAATGEVLLETLVNPQGEPIAAEAAANHGITPEMVSDSDVPAFAELHDELVQLLSGKRIVCWKAAFDRQPRRTTSPRGQRSAGLVELGEQVVELLDAIEDVIGSEGELGDV
jgi:hypothetical protein